jgi:hypothetical protein
MIRHQEMTDDQQLLMTHALKTGKTNHMGESKANQTTRHTQNNRSFPNGSNLPTEKP